MGLFHVRTTALYNRFLHLVTVILLLPFQLSIEISSSTHVAYAFSISNNIPSRTNSRPSICCHTHDDDNNSNAVVSPKSDKNNNSRSSSDYSNLKFHKVYLRQNEPLISPWCYALTVDPTVPSSSSSVPDQPQTYNFLASQVWPSARVAAASCESYIMDCIKSTTTLHDTNDGNANNFSSNPKPIKDWKICELGCGPALPSLTLAKLGMNVIATDIDELALFMASKAAQEQNVDVTSFQTKIVDLTANYNDDGENASIIDEINADLYILSDVFESNDVAIGAARLTNTVLKRGARVWVFAQSDRAQREAYRVELMNLLNSSCDNIDNDGINGVYGDLLEWKFVKDISGDYKNRNLNKLLLCDLDEVLVEYG